MTYFQRIATLILLSLFVIQILAKSISPQQDNDNKKGKFMTVTFENPVIQVTVTVSDAEKATQLPDRDIKEKKEGASSIKHEEEQQQHYKQEKPTTSAAQKHQEGEDEQQMIEEELAQGHGEGMPFDDYMGDEIDQMLDEPHSDMDPYVIEEETDLSPSSSIDAEEAAVSAINKTTTEVTAPTGPRSPMAQITGCKTQGQIALTYSEGPSDVTAKIVRQLTKADARANFFVNATWLNTQQYSMVVQNTYKAGHLIGMNYRVINDDPSSMTDEALRQDIINNAHVIESLIDATPKYVRLHYTEVKDVRTEGILRDLGFVIVGYNLDSQDYFKKNATGPGSVQQIYSETFKNYKDTYDAKGTFISIQYDLPYTCSLAAIPHIINTIDEEGYTMVRLDGCLNDPTPYKKSANSTEYVGDKFSFSQPGYHQGQKSIVLETEAEAALADEEFKRQGLETSMASTQQLSVSLFLGVICAIFSLLL